MKQILQLLQKSHTQWFEGKFRSSHTSYQIEDLAERVRNISDVHNYEKFFQVLLEHDEKILCLIEFNCEKIFLDINTENENFSGIPQNGKLYLQFHKEDIEIVLIFDERVKEDEIAIGKFIARSCNLSFEKIFEDNKDIVISI